MWVINCAQREIGRDTCSAFAARQWLKEYRPKVALHPHKSDYCDTCKFLKEEIARQNAVLKRLAQSGSAQAQNLTDVQGNIEVAEQELRTHPRSKCS